MRMVSVNPMLAIIIRLSPGSFVSMFPVYRVQFLVRFSGWLNVMFLDPGWKYSLDHFALRMDRDLVPR